MELKTTTWGIKPVLFSIYQWQVHSYEFFLLLAIIVGSLIYYREIKKSQVNPEYAFIIIITALIGGAVGAKLPVLIQNYKLIIQRWPDITPILSGRTILGGLIGGVLVIYIVKKKLKITVKLGNQIAPALAMGMFIGRFGCFLRGCCYGIPTRFQWGCNFGDGILRYPTQLVDGFFNLGLFFVLIKLKKKIIEPGRLFQIYLQSYFSFRFFIEFLRQEPRPYWDLTLAQLSVLIFFGFIFLRELYKKATSSRKERGAIHG